MPASKKILEPWNSFLTELDEKATEQTRLDCMGGFVVTQLYGFSRETSDLDVLVIAPKDQFKPLLELGRQGGELHKRHKVYLDYVGVAKVPEDYEGRLTEMFPKTYRHLRLCALDPYDLALSKLERNIQSVRFATRFIKHSARRRLRDLTLRVIGARRTINE